MHVFLGGVDPTFKTRSHPYEGAAYNDPMVKHYSFVQNLHLIRDGVLEDFVLWEHYSAVQSFYQFLEWINGPESIFESSDCRLERPKKNPNRRILRTQVLCGRVMVFFRELERNLVVLQPQNRYEANEDVKELTIGCKKYFESVFPDTYWVGLDLFLSPTRYRDIVGDNQVGQQLMIQFNCFGNGEQRLFDAFGIAVEAISGALRQLNIELLKK